MKAQSEARAVEAVQDAATREVVEALRDAMRVAQRERAHGLIGVLVLPGGDAKLFQISDPDNIDTLIASLRRVEWGLLRQDAESGP